jgi:hypothetical protein
MLIKACNEIARISETDEGANAENYMAAVGHISNLYRFVDAIKNVVPAAAKLRFLPTFKDKYVSSKYGILSTEEENDMREFRIKSAYLSDESFRKKVKDALKDICDETDSQIGDEMAFIMRIPGKKE